VANRRAAAEYASEAAAAKTTPGAVVHDATIYKDVFLNRSGKSLGRLLRVNCTVMDGGSRNASNGNGHLCSAWSVARKVIGLIFPNRDVGFRW